MPRLTQALQTNIFGLNNRIIAQLEAQYGEMWAQNSGTMYSYAASSATASQVTPFTDAPTITNPAAASLQSAAASQQPGLLDPKLFPIRADQHHHPAAKHLEPGCW